MNRIELVPDCKESIENGSDIKGEIIGKTDQHTIVRLLNKQVIRILNEHILKVDADKD